MNLIPAIKSLEQEISNKKQELEEEIKELESGLEALRKLNTVCEKCSGKGKYLRRRSCAEDDRPDENDPTDYLTCNECRGSGRARTNDK